MTSISDLSDNDRKQVGQAWLEAGLGEHASVAAFARLVLHLMSLGATPELLRDAIRAMDDEVEHARLCFGIAKCFTGVAAGPGPMDLSGESNDPGTILEAAILEGCIAETISARCAQVALERLKHESIRPALTRIAQDESRHADLSWNFVDWMLQTYPELAASAANCFSRALASPVPAERETVNQCTALEDFGHLLAATKARVAEAVILKEIRPRKDALLRAHSLRHVEAAPR